MYKLRGVLLVLQVFLSVSLSAAGTLWAAAQDDPKLPDVIRAGRRLYEVLDYSPDHRFAFVWSSRGKSINVAQYHSFLTELNPNWDATFDPVDSIVDCKEHRVVATLKDCNHFPRRGHSDVIALWGRNNRYAVIFWDGKWSPREFFTVALSGSRTGKVTPFYSHFQASLRSSLLYATGKRTGGDAIGCWPFLDDRNHLFISAYSYMSKAETGWSDHCTLEYLLSHNGNIIGIQPRIFGFVVAKEQAAIDDEGSDTYLRSLVVAQVSRDGRSSRRADFCADIRRDVLRRIKESVPKELSAKRDLTVDADITNSSHDLDNSPNHLEISINVGSKRGHRVWIYTATYVYRIKFDRKVPVIMRLRVSDEKIEQNVD